MRFSRVSFLLLPLFVLWLAACGRATPQTQPSATLAPATQAVSAPAASGQTVFIIDPGPSRASYTVHEQFFEKALPKLGINPGEKEVTGVTEQVEGEIHVNLDDLTQPLTGTVIRVDLTGLKTDQSRRDKWIQENGPTFLKYPTATFVAREIRQAPPSYQEGQEVSFQLAGDLTIHDITHPAVFDVTAKLEKDTLTGVATTQIKMSDFGIDPPSFAQTLTVGDDVLIKAEIVAKKQ